MNFARSGGIGPEAKLSELFDHLSRIAWHIALTLVTMYFLTLTLMDQPAEVSAFIFTEAIGVVYLLAKLGVAAQIAILFKYGALFEPEAAYDKIKKLKGIRLSVWFLAMDLLLNPLLVDAPKELRARSLWDDIWRDAQNRALDRKSESYVSPFNRKAERFLSARYAAQDRRARLRLWAAALGTLLMLIGVTITEYLRRREGF